MANEVHQIGLPMGTGRISNGKKIAGSTIATGDGLDATTYAATASLNTLRAALTGANAAYYTAARMNGMNYNDLLFSWLSTQGYKS